MEKGIFIERKIKEAQKLMGEECKEKDEPTKMSHSIPYL